MALLKPIRRLVRDVQRDLWPTPEDAVLQELERRAQRESRLRLAGMPAELVVSNHVMGLYELAAIHLSAEPPSLVEAALAGLLRAGGDLARVVALTASATPDAGDAT